jgi:7-cyano-7-deazaguanine synthase
MKRKAVVLLSGGLDSAVTLFYAREKGYECHCLAFDYGQRHIKEISCARRLARRAGAGLKTMKLCLPWRGSSLTDRSLSVPSGRTANQIRRGGIPSTYVPGRNTIFLSLAVSYAEAIGADSVFIGAHVQDSSGYPDCRKGYLEAFNKVVRSGTKRGLEGRLRLEYPLIGKNKAAIIKLGTRLGVPFELTWSCYKGGPKPCGESDSCVLRARGFEEAGLTDPIYA